MKGLVRPVIALSGGVGGAKLADGLAQRLGEALTVVVNTADDFEHLGFYISPDIDTVTYTLAGLANHQNGWGLQDETWTFMEQLSRLGGPDWFRLGDRDLATHAFRTDRIKVGKTLTEVTQELCAAFGISSKILPMCNAPVRTIVHNGAEKMDFQDYFVRHGCRNPVTAISFKGLSEASVGTELLQSLHSATAVLIGPSNPFLSVDPIISVPGFRSSLTKLKVPIVAVSPIIGGKAVKGPAAKIMSELNIPVSAVSVAKHYAELIDGIVIDEADRGLAKEIEAIGVMVHVTNTVMQSSADRLILADECLSFARNLDGDRLVAKSK